MEMKGRRYWIEYAKDKWEEMNHVMVKDYEKIFKHLFLQPVSYTHLTLPTILRV